MSQRDLAASFRPAPTWSSIYKAMFNGLIPHIVSILASTPFYDRHDLKHPHNLKRGRLKAEERYATEQIASALTHASVAAHAAPLNVIRAWLRAIADNPGLLFSAQCPPEAHDLVVGQYRRAFEKSGTHFEDLVGRRKIRGLNKPDRATFRNIRRAALSAKSSLPRQKVGRPRNVANEILAEQLGRTFRSFGGRIARRQIRNPKASSRSKFLQDGPFFHFVSRVTEPLNAHLKQHGFPPVSSKKIEKIAARRSLP